jgi:hypothetical protein
MTATVEFPLYFAFPDGVFHHVCPECTALCCRGQGFAGNLKREMSFLLGEYPALNRFVTDREKNLLTCATPTGQCFFLRSDNLCQIEVTHGKARKPGVCLLFPFNDFYRIGNTVVVSPHFMCPLRLELPAAPGKVEGTHARIKEAINDTMVLEPDYVRDYLPPATLPESESPEFVVRRETQFRDLCGDGLGRMKFQEVLEKAGGRKVGLKSFQRRVLKLMKWSAPETNGMRDDLDDLLLAVAPSLRMETLSQGGDALLRFLTLAEVVVRGGLRMSQARPTLQAVYGLVDDLRPVIRLLSWADDAPVLKKAPLKSPPLGDPNLVFAGYKVIHDVQKLGVLPSLEKAFRPDFTAADRNALFFQLSETIDPAIKKRR